MSYRFYTCGPGHNFSVTDDGRVGRTDLERDAEPHEQWRIVGAVRYNFGREAQRWTWEELRQAILDRSMQWQYANGKQRVFLCYYDHGSLSIWASPPGYSMYEYAKSHPYRRADLEATFAAHDRQD